MKGVPDTAAQRIADANTLADDLRFESDDWTTEHQLIAALEVIGLALIAIGINLEEGKPD